MKHLLLFFFLVLPAIHGRVYAQLPDGATAPDWTLTDIYGVTHHLYDLLDEGKMVVLKFSATWCGPCWNYLNTGALETFWEEHGPNGSDEAQVFYIESDFSTGMNDLLGLTGSSQGNWVAAIPFPIIDLQPGQPVASQYQISYYPTLYAVCQDRKIYELGQVPAFLWAEFIESCAFTPEIAAIEEAVCYQQGQIEVATSGGTTPISFLWSTGATGPVLQNISAGTYSVTATEGNGRQKTIENIVVGGASVPMSVSQETMEPAICFGTSTASLSIDIDDGHPPFTFLWNNGAQTQNLSQVPAGTYTVSATDVNGCFANGSFTVTQPDELEVAYGVTPEYCFQANGTVTLSIQGGVGGYIISATLGTINGHVIEDLEVGSIVVEVEDNNGCSWSETIDIDFEPEHSISFTPNPAVTCQTPVTTITGFVTGGTNDFLYYWSTQNGVIIGPDNLPVVTVGQGGEYSLAVSDLVSGCEVTNTVTVVSVTDPPEISAGDDTFISCEVTEQLLSGTGDPSLVISWSTPNGNIVNGQGTYQPQVNQPGLYILHATNPANSCTNTDTVAVVNQIDPAVAAFTFQTSGLIVSATDASTGSQIGSWTWSMGNGDILTGQQIIYTYAAEGSYDLCLTVENGCGISQTCQRLEVSLTGGAIIAVPVIIHVKCHGDSTGSIHMVVNGGSGNYTYAWTGPDGATYTTSSLDDIPEGQYELVIHDDQGGSFSAVFTVTQPDALEVGGTTTDTPCYGTAEGVIALTVSGGVEPYTYHWLPGGFGTPEIDQLPAGSYTCMITDNHDCIMVYNGEIFSPEALSVILVDVLDPSGTGQSDGHILIEVTGGTPPYQIAWSNGATGTSNADLPPGEYTYEVTDANGCILATHEPIVLQGGVASQDIRLYHEVMIRPNPSSGQVIVSWNDIAIQHGDQMILRTVDGKPLATNRMQAREGIWEMTSLSLQPGVYILQVKNGGKTASFKLVVL